MFNWWGSRPLLQKLILGFSLVLLLASCATAVTVYGVFQLKAQQMYTDDKLRIPLAAAQETLSALHLYDGDVSQAIIDRTPAGKDDITNSAADRQKLTAFVDRLRGFADDANTRNALAHFDQANAAPKGYEPQEERALQFRELNKFDEADTLLVNSDINPSLKALNEYRTAFQARVDAGALASRRAASIYSTIGIILSVAAIAIGLGIAFTLARSIAGTIQTLTGALSGVVQEDFVALTEALANLADGDLNAEFGSHRSALPERGDDEITALVRMYNMLCAGLGQTATQFATATAQLRELISGVARTSKLLAAASDDASSAAKQSTVAIDQIAQAINVVASSAADQASKIADTATAIEELSRTSEQIAQVAENQSESISLTTTALQKLDRSIGSLSSQGATLAAAAREASTETGTGNAAVSETASTIAETQSGFNDSRRSDVEPRGAFVTSRRNRRYN